MQNARITLNFHVVALGEKCSFLRFLRPKADRKRKYKKEHDDSARRRKIPRDKTQHMAVHPEDWESFEVEIECSVATQLDTQASARKCSHTQCLRLLVEKAMARKSDLPRMEDFRLFPRF